MAFKRHLFLSILFIGFSIFGIAQASKPKLVLLDTLLPVGLRSMNHYAFDVGEKLTYRLHYGFVDAGEAVVEVVESKKQFEGREALHVIGNGKTLGAFNWFYKVRDHYESYIDKQGVFPWKFVRRVNEGGYEINQDYIFHQQVGAVDNGKGKTFQMPEAIQDMLSSFYYARTLDFSDIKPGRVYTITTFMDDELFELNIKYVGKETVSLRAGKFKCLKFIPVVQEGRIFKSDEDLQVWITDDANKIPILAKAKILVGSIKMEVVEYEGLANPISKIG